ncbi:hypothetical protein QJS66_21470 [Kocuria rhizophila]|nr:hypothetical protein QJS66_21470 [Kocuria rhizophila]
MVVARLPVVEAGPFGLMAVAGGRRGRGMRCGGQFGCSTGPVANKLIAVHSRTTSAMAGTWPPSTGCPRPSVRHSGCGVRGSAGSRRPPPVINAATFLALAAVAVLASPRLHPRPPGHSPRTRRVAWLPTPRRPRAFGIAGLALLRWTVFATSLKGGRALALPAPRADRRGGEAPRGHLWGLGVVLGGSCGPAHPARRRRCSSRAATNGRRVPRARRVPARCAVGVPRLWWRRRQRGLQRGRVPHDPGRCPGHGSRHGAGRVPLDRDTRLSPGTRQVARSASSTASWPSDSPALRSPRRGAGAQGCVALDRCGEHRTAHGNGGRTELARQ